MRRASLVSALLAVVIGSGLAIAETTAPAAKAQTVEKMAEGMRLRHEAMNPEK